MRGILKNTLLLLGGMDGYIITLPQPKPITYKEEP